MTFTVPMWVLWTVGLVIGGGLACVVLALAYVGFMVVKDSNNWYR